jgi:hypothetical protein
MWELHKGHRTARCELWQHRLGFWGAPWHSRLARGNFTTTTDLARKIRRYIDHHNRADKQVKRAPLIPTGGTPRASPSSAPPTRHPLVRSSPRRSQTRRHPSTSKPSYPSPGHALDGI